MSPIRTDPREIERELIAAISDGEYLRRENAMALREPPRVCPRTVPRRR